MKIKSLLTFICSIFILVEAYSQPGSVDLTFNPTDLGYNNGEGADNPIYSTAIQSDGKIIIGGAFTNYNGIAINGLARLNADGTLDATFAVGSGVNGYLKSVLIQSDGKILIAGSFNSFNGNSRNNIARINTDGSIDASFNPGTGTDDVIESMILQSNSKIIIVGWFTVYNGSSRSRISRINSDGSTDGSFTPGTAADDKIFSIAIKSDGKILIGGDFTTYGGTSIKNLAQLNTNGTLDATFNSVGIGPDNRVNSIVMQSDGKILIGGWFLLYNGGSRGYLARLNSDGSLDIGFDSYTATSSVVYSISVQSDGKILIGGDFDFYKLAPRNRVARINSDGTVDASFNPGTGANNKVFSITILADGKLIISGFFTSYDGLFTNHIACVNTNGSVYSNFNFYTAIKGEVDKSLIQGDGKILIGGYFNVYNGTFRNNIARVNSDGSNDTGFTPGKGTDDQVTSLALQSDSKIIIGGRFTLYNGTAANRIARLKSDGTIDASFSTGTGFDNYVWALAVQADDKIIAGGTFTSYNGTTKNGIVRLNTDGSIDATFNVGTGVNGGNIETISIQTDGKIIIAGSFTSYNGSTRNRVLRLNTDGSIDTGFSIGTGVNGTVYTSAIQSDGKIIVAGTFTSYNATSRKNILRINTNGSVDVGFAPGTSNGQITSVSIQADSKIIIGGLFTSYASTSRNRIARLTSNSSLDLTFDPGTAATSDVYCTSIQADGKIIIGGRFTSYNGTGRHRITRVKNDIRINTTISSNSFCKGNSLTVSFTVISGPLNAGNTFTAQLSSASGNFASNTIIGTLSSTVDGTINATIPTSVSGGAGYRIRVVSDNVPINGNDNGTNITIYNLPSVTLSPFSDICENATPLSLFLGTPNGGSYSGTGVSGASFNPTVATPGTYPISYTYTDGNGCTNTASQNINVLAKPAVSLSSFTSKCVDAPSFTLTGGAPSSGTYAVDGTTATSFNPAAALAGPHAISYTVIGANNCSNTATSPIQVNALPVITLNNFSDVCINKNTFALTAGSPISGIYSGTGVNAGSFNPAVATVGTYPITYSYTDANGCFNSTSKSITVNSMPTVDLGSFANVCKGSAVVALTGGIPAGGAYSGTGVSSGNFNPTSAGTFTITYSYTDANSCTSTANSSITTTICTDALSATETNRLSVFPNPSEGIITVSAPFMNYSLELYNSQGHVVYNANLIEMENKINLPDLAKGLYTLKVDHDKKTETIRIVIK